MPAIAPVPGTLPKQPLQKILEVLASNFEENWVTSCPVQDRPLDYWEAFLQKAGNCRLQKEIFAKFSTYLFQLVV